MTQDQIDIFEDGGRKLLKAIDHLDERDFTAHPVPGKWSIAQLVAHVTDCDLVLAERVKRVVSEDNPPLVAFDEEKWAAALHYEVQPTRETAELFALHRRLLAGTLRLLPAEAFKRTGTHSARGPMTADQILEMAVKHLDHHLTFLYEKREALGKILW
ncbi:MAG TPA: DinB family protein [Humisphaera sp.]